MTTIGKSDVKRPGKDVTLVTYSKMLQVSMKAVQQLETDGIDVEVIDLRSLRPLDMDPVYASFKKTNRCVIVEEGWATRVELDAVITALREWGELPDAFASWLYCGALGWLSRE